ncbi:MAG: type II secretion system protein [Planctomycetota bacterium]
MPNRDHNRRIAFTLIELLVVVAIIALLISILMPALGQARASGKLAVCASNLRQLGTGIHAYAIEYAGFIPRGPEPEPDNPYDFTANTVATNQLWIGVEGMGPPPAHPREYQGLGCLLTTTCPDPKVYYCPADDIADRTHELPKIGTDQDAYSSYLYRQLDHLSPDYSRGLLDELGTNEFDDQVIRVEALALDMNSLGPGTYYHSNHNAKTANILYRDASVRRYQNRDNCLAIPPEIFANPLDVFTAIDQLLSNADFAYHHGHPADGPRLPDWP